MTSPHRATTRPFTIALCISCTSSADVAVLQDLRKSIRRCAHGVLVTTGCLRGTITCATRPHGPGTVLMLQPCSVERVPSGPTRWIGPLIDLDDLRAVCDWLERGEWDLTVLPTRLHAELNSARAVSHRN
ncbi:hypothetical protein TUM20985_40210 [Mycobacterium antarcticum]|nr:hypothetical protein TUM20985_40210 [Mycolicibacterium sp. TUM20985]GLP82915.1 hypothetical protein TUM20984_43350 [Mycolicibacterium sp. TUM20984]